ncbi:MAG: DUF255 domain-containing protein [Isosphaeraceae bacterium]|nr:DUF255 domain-containing protein [Isosphaeraceae bacterium]
MPRPHCFLAGALALLVSANVASGQEAKNAQRPANRLARETSPYLLLHAHNPVDWYPWGPEAFARAKAENKPVFLSVGYSSCFWCHVMERECFENAEIAKLLNARFVCVKVDREERPDVDQIYMSAIQAFGGGGWPMSVFLTPDGRPFYGGTYFPPKERDGIPAFPTVLNGVADAWRDERAQVEKAAEQLTGMVRKSLAGAASKRRAPLSRALASAGRAALTEDFDPEYGGFGYNPQNARRPKFPEPGNLVFLLDQHRRDRKAKKSGDETPDKPAPLAMVATTLDRMARGGIRDQIAGGYHRYSVSRYWIVPHFEKMLYDNAQLAEAHLLAFEATGDPRWQRETEDTFAFVARSLTAPEGAFYSALDAETRGEEGGYYVWTREEVKDVLGGGADGDAFNQVYGLKRDPNFEKGRYVLLEPRTRAEQAETLKTTPDALEKQLVPLRTRMLAAREKRPAPLRDDKVLTAWNGLMIAAYAEGYRVLKDERYKQAAEKAADFVLKTLRTPDGRLLRTYRAGQARLPAYLEDYAYLVHGLLRLHAATGDAQRLAQARTLADRMIADFADDAEGGFYFTAGDHESLLARPKTQYDGVLPGPNSLAVRDLVALGVLTREARYLDRAGRALEAFSGSMAQNPIGFPCMLLGLEEYLDARPTPEVVAGAALPGGNDVLSAEAALDLGGGKVGPGATLDVTVTVTLKKGWHIYANPTSDDLKPTTLVVAPDQDATLVKVTYPAGESKQLVSTGDAKVAVYEGRVVLAAQVKLGQGPPPDALKLQLRYQACDDRACLAPATLAVPVSLIAKR